ncbi:cation:proton antiporter [Candidatus Nomurabacteria bacterium]|nr:cation:proton antiporter [Candidatus Nomurabacteria bacterium]
MSHFVEFSLLIALAAAVAVVMRLIKQPLIIGHIVTGLIAGMFFSTILGSVETLKLFSEIGIAILLFLVGLHLHPKNVKEFGSVSLITGIGQVVFTSAVGFGICMALGLGTIPSIYVGIGLAFSSTIIVLKLISDKGDIDSLYGRISIGFLLVQDIIAILILFALPLIASGDFALGTIVLMLLKATLLLAIMYLISKEIIPRIGTFMERSQELLFLFTIAWGLGISALFYIAGFSIESGALVAGISLATLPSRREVSARLTPLRDFFIIMFFVLLGAQMDFGTIGPLIPSALILSALVLIGNPLILMTIMGLLGYKKKTSLQTGFTVAQISEFSLIVIALGAKIGHLNNDVVSLVTLVGLITIFGSTYLISYSDQIYYALEKYLSIFERKETRQDTDEYEAYDIILFGAGRVGQKFHELFQKDSISHLIIDQNPDIIEKLRTQGLNVVYGDGSNITFIEELNFNDAKIVISTVPDNAMNAIIFDVTRRAHPDTLFVATATTKDEALEMYEMGVDYVIMPHLLGSQHAASLFEQYMFQRDGYDMMRHHHLNELRSHDVV